MCGKNVTACHACCGYAKETTKGSPRRNTWYLPLLRPRRAEFSTRERPTICAPLRRNEQTNKRRNAVHGAFVCVAIAVLLHTMAEKSGNHANSFNKRAICAWLQVHGPCVHRTGIQVCTEAGGSPGAAWRENSKNTSLQWGGVRGTDRTMAVLSPITRVKYELLLQGYQMYL